MRQRLPNRRPHISHRMTHDGQAYIVTVGYDPETEQPLEVFFTGRGKGHMEPMLYDMGVTLSLALQRGTPAHELKHSLCRLEDGRPASIVGRVVDELV